MAEQESPFVSRRFDGRWANAIRALAGGYWSVAWSWLAHGRPF